MPPRNRWGKKKNGQENGGQSRQDSKDIHSAATTVDEILMQPIRFLKEGPSSFMSSSDESANFLNKRRYQNHAGEFALAVWAKNKQLQMSPYAYQLEQDMKTCLIGGSIYLPKFFDDPANLMMETILREVKESERDGLIASIASTVSSTIGEEKGENESKVRRTENAAAIENVTFRDWSKHQLIENCDSKSVTFSRIIKVLSEYFDVDILATRLNFYKDETHWKPFHKDSHAYAVTHTGEKVKEDFTLGVSFGASRALEFQHDDCAELQFGFPQHTGDVFAFTDLVNSRFQHGVPKTTEKVGPRISIIGWGKRRSLNARNGGF